MSFDSEHLINKQILDSSFTNKFVIEKIKEKNPKFASLLKLHNITQVFLNFIYFLFLD